MKERLESFVYQPKTGIFPSRPNPFNSLIKFITWKISGLPVVLEFSLAIFEKVASASLMLLESKPKPVWVYVKVDLAPPSRESVPNTIPNKNLAALNRVVFDALTFISGIESLFPLGSNASIFPF